MSGIMLPIMGELAGQQQVIAPNQIPNLTIWYDGANGTSANFQSVKTNGSIIGQWNDISGSGHDANPFGGTSKDPTYTIPIQNNLGAVTFNPASQQNLDVNPISWARGLSGFTIYVMARPTTFASKFPLTVTDGNLGIAWTGSTWQVGGGGGLGTVTPTNDTSKFHIYGSIFNGTGTGNSGRLQFRYDKAVQTLNYGSTTVGTTTSTSATTFFFGGDARDTVFGYMTGYIGEVLIWTRALTASEITSVETYLSLRWAP